MLQAFLQEHYMLLVILYMLVMSIVSFIQMCVDKHRAKTGRWRIRERTLLLTAALGGSPGALLGMLLCRHKTNARRHPAFAVGVPVMLALHALLLWYLLNL